MGKCFGYLERATIFALHINTVIWMNKKIGVLIYENVQPMDFMGPWEVFSFWKNVLNAPIDMYLVSEDGSYVECDNNIVVKTHLDFEHCPALDCLIIPGGRGRLVQVNNEKIIHFIKKQANYNQYIISICTGIFLLYQAGLLKDKAATTYWRAMPELQSFSDVKVIENRVVKDGKIWSSGGVSSGIDLALELIAEINGKEIAGQVQLLFEYFPRDTLYSSMDSAKALPAYKGSFDFEPAAISRYIQDYIQSKNYK